MKLKFKFLGLIILACILIIATAFSVFGNQTEIDEDKTLTNFFEDVVNSGETFNMTDDYKFQNNESGLILGGGDLTINGNGHKLDFANGIPGLILDNKGNDVKVVINNLTIMNSQGPALVSSDTELVLNNVVFENCTADDKRIAYISESDNVVFNNCTFKSNSNASDLYSDHSNITVNHSVFLDGDDSYSSIEQNRGTLKINDCNFENDHSNYGGILNYKGNQMSVKNSNFSNSKASLTGGAIVAKYFPELINDTTPVPSDAMVIENCSFSHLSSRSNGGAIYMDMDSGSLYVPQTLNVVNCNFTNCYSGFGGAIVNLGGTLNVNGSKFINCAAKSEGGAMYTSWTNLNIANSTLSNNLAKSNASAIYFDNGTFTVKNSNLTDNKVIPSNFMFRNIISNAVYANDADIHFVDSKIDNGGEVYGNFIKNAEIKNVTSKDAFSLNNTDYIVSVENKGIKLDLKNNTMSTDKLPSKYDARDFNWSSPLKYQGDNLACWAFATVGTVECSLLKSTGVLYNLSENNVQDVQLRYNPIGDVRNNVTGFAYSGLGYALSWNGMVSAQDDPYDERGMISERVNSDRIHVQDAKIIFLGNDTVKSVKQAIMDYGAVSIQFKVGDFDYNYHDKALQPTHFVTLIGWNDSIPAKNFKDIDDNNTNPPKPGGWIVKDSEGLEVGDDGYDYISYYDKSFLADDHYAVVPQGAAVAYIFENTNDYHVNYQTDLTGLTGFDGNYTYYSNEFTSKYNESIGAVGTYFNDSDIDYSFDVYVNGKLMHSQNGTSEFAGYKTIVLDKYVPIKTGDKFKVVFKNNNVPYQAFSRQHYAPEMSFVGDDGQSWKDITLDNKTVCLKIYTLK